MAHILDGKKVAQKLKDNLKVEIENIGYIENNIVQEPKSTSKY